MFHSISPCLYYRNIAMFITNRFQWHHISLWILTWFQMVLIIYLHKFETILFLTRANKETYSFNFHHELKNRSLLFAFLFCLDLVVFKSECMSMKRPWAWSCSAQTELILTFIQSLNAIRLCFKRRSLCQIHSKSNEIRSEKQKWNKHSILNR